MRDYFVLWKYVDVDGITHWFEADPGPYQFPNIPDLTNPSIKVFVRVPDKKLLTDFFNKYSGFPTQNGMTLDTFSFSFAAGWSRMFGGNTEGGYLKLASVPTSDAFGALYGRPARSPDGRFIRYRPG
jgi:hypothetical protein